MSLTNDIFKLMLSLVTTPLGVNGSTSDSKSDPEMGISSILIDGTRLHYIESIISYS